MTSIDNDLSMLPSFRFYNILNDGGHKLYEESFWIGFETSLHSYKEISAIFDKLKKGIYYASYIGSTNSFFKERWNYLYFWMGEKVLDVLRDNNSKFSLIMYLLNTVKNHFEKKDYDFKIYNVTADNFKNLKVVYDYFQNYEYIRGHVTASLDCTAKYRDYIEEAFDSYKKLIQQCETKSTEDFCVIFNGFLETYNKKNLSKLTCNGLKPPQEYVHVPTYGLDFESETETPLHGSQRHIGYSGNSSTGSNIMTFVYPLLAIFIISFILYKFTSLGSFLHLHLKRGKHNLKNKLDQEYQHYSDNSEIDNIHLDSTDHYISYHSF
ncbi:PIR protein [Plasmodium ovale]|uniref:PIR protein n=1 Tax=Plasmodium ovale TaxID=36330 RepID=A0A1C3KJT2_PLAOA|nr:PIR protein [Plasmodium ovale]